jgi:hypothetical protein
MRDDGDGLVWFEVPSLLSSIHSSFHLPPHLVCVRDTHSSSSLFLAAAAPFVSLALALFKFGLYT